MGETESRMKRIEQQLKEIPEEIVKAAQDQYAARMEGFAEGFAAGKAHADKQ